MAILETLEDVEKSLLGVVGDVVGLGTEVASDVVKAAAAMVRDVIDTLGGAVKD